MNAITEIEAAARASGDAERHVKGRAVRCTIVGATMPYGRTLRATWFVDGRRSSRNKASLAVSA